MMIRLFLIALILLTTPSIYATDLHVFAPKNLKGVMIEICEFFEKIHEPWKVQLRTGSSFDLSKLITRGSTADVFLLGDEKSLGGLKERKLVQDVNLFLADDLVIISAATSKLEIQDPSKLAYPELKGVALFSETSTFGKASREYLKKIGIWDAVQTKIGIQKDTKSLLKSLQAGETDWTILYRSDVVHSNGMKVLWKIPEKDFAPHLYFLGSVTASSQKEGIRQFLETIQSTIAKKFFENAGLRVIAPKQ
jgi:molybdate transport system substrate-binding protein